MKTQTLLTAILALSIQVMVNGQTPDNQIGNGRARTLPTLGAIKAHTASQATQALKTTSNTQTIAITSSSPQNNVYYNVGSYKELLTQAEELLSDAKILRNEAENNTGPEREAYLKQANIIYKQAEANQLKAAEIAGKTNKEQYRINKENLNAILVINQGDEYATQQAKDLISDASFNIRLGQEMREEAYAMPTSASKLGSLVNAEEKEALALKMQNKAVEILKASNPQLAGNITAIINGNTLAIR